MARRLVRWLEANGREVGWWAHEDRPDVRLELGGRIVGVELTSVTDGRVAATYACFSELETELRRVLGARGFSVSAGLDVARALQVAARGGSALGPADLGKAARILKVSFRPRASSDDVDSVTSGGGHEIERLRANLDGLLERKGGQGCRLSRRWERSRRTVAHRDFRRSGSSAPAASHRAAALRFAVWAGSLSLRFDHHGRVDAHFLRLAASTLSTARGPRGGHRSERRPHSRPYGGMHRTGRTPGDPDQGVTMLLAQSSFHSASRQLTWSG